MNKKDEKKVLDFINEELEKREKHRRTVLKGLTITLNVVSTILFTTLILGGFFLILLACNMMPQLSYSLTTDFGVMLLGGVLMIIGIIPMVFGVMYLNYDPEMED